MHKGREPFTLSLVSNYANIQIALLAWRRFFSEIIQIQKLCTKRLRNALSLFLLKKAAIINKSAKILIDAC